MAIQQLGMSVTLQTTIDDAQARVTDALKAHGFGVLTEINVQNTLKQKINVDFHPYRILGACNPHFAHRALTTAPDIGLLLPCNVTLAEKQPGQIEVSIINPIAMAQVADLPELQALAEEAREVLQRALASLLS
jgi:uncharacterized protein (DUF302 family)